VNLSATKRGGVDEAKRQTLWSGSERSHDGTSKGGRFAAKGNEREGGFMHSRPENGLKIIERQGWGA